MSATPIKSYFCTFGIATVFNRKIEFCKVNGKIVAEAFGFVDGSWRQVGRIEESHMTKKVAFAVGQTKLFSEGPGKAFSTKYPETWSFSNLPYDEKIRIIEALGPEKKYRIAVTKIVEAAFPFERITDLLFIEGA